MLARGLRVGVQVVFEGTDSSVRGASKKRSRGSRALIPSRGNQPIAKAGELSKREEEC